MKKIPFYNPASPSFFHFSVLLLYILIFLPLLLLSFSLFSTITFITLIFSAIYPFFVLVMAILVRGAYINIHQTPISEQFTNKLVLYNRYLITAIYVFSLGVWVFYLGTGKFLDATLVSLFFLFISGLCFLFYLFILPVIIRFLLLKKRSLLLEIIIVGIFFLLFLLGLYIINMSCGNCIFKLLTLVELKKYNLV